jgi:hypothetical protein
MAEAAITLSQALDRAMAGEPILPVCQIRWIDAQGNPTPDTNPAIGRVRCKGHDQIIAGRMVHFTTSEWFHIAQNMLRRLASREWKSGNGNAARRTATETPPTASLQVA